MPRAKRNANLEFVIRQLAANPGATSTSVRRAMAAHNGKEFRPGFYCWYFNSAAGSRAWGYGFSNGVDLGLWEKRDGGWHLTEAGLARR